MAQLIECAACGYLRPSGLLMDGLCSACYESKLIEENASLKARVADTEAKFESCNRARRAAEEKVAERRLAKLQQCGCIVCDCVSDLQCHGCGAKHCGTHPAGQIPNPIYQPVVAESATTDDLCIATSIIKMLENDIKEGNIKFSKQDRMGYHIDPKQFYDRTILEFNEALKNKE